MAVSTQTVVLEFDAKTGEVLKATSQLQKSMDDVAQSAEDAAEATSEIGKNAKSAGTGLKKAGTLGAQGFKLVGTAIAATGLLGLVTKVLMPIVDAFMENKKVADTLRIAMAGIGAVIDTIVDLTGPLVDRLFAAFSNPKQAVIDLKDAIKENIETRIEGLLNLLPRLGDAIKAAFSGNFAEAGKIAADAVGQVALGVENVTDKVADAVDAVIEYKDEFIATVSKQVQSATALEKAMIALDDRQRDLNVRSAEATAAVEELKRQRDDERLSIEERIDAAERAAEIDQERADEQVAIAEERARLLRQEIQLQGETEERLDALAEAQIAAADARAASAGVQTELTTSLISLDNERLAQVQELADAEKERLDGIIERQTEIDLILSNAREREEFALLQWYEEQKRLARENGQILVGLEEAYEQQLAAIRKKYDDEELADEKAVLDQKRQMTFAALSALQSLNDAFSSADEEGARQAFKRNKALSLASAVLNTGQAITDALKGPELFPGGRFIEAAITGAAGLAQIQNIRKTQFQGSNPPPPPPEGPPPAGGFAAGAANAPGAPTLDLGFLGAGSEQQVIETYVISENVTNAQQANKKIQDQATL